MLSSTGHDADEARITRDLGLTTAYNNVIGNSYTASVYLALTALLDQADDLTDQAVGFLSYGSGSVAEFFAGTVVPGYREHLRTAAHRKAIDRRKSVKYARYRTLHERYFPADGGVHPTPIETTGPYRLAALRDHKRVYEARVGRSGR